MPDDGRPVLTRVDYQCLFAAGSSITTTWFGSADPSDVVAAWYRRTLDGYVERAPNDWVRKREAGTDLVVVAPGQQWPAGVPAPAQGWSAEFRTLIMQSSITSRVEADQVHRPRWRVRLMHFLKKASRPRRRPG